MIATRSLMDPQRTDSRSPGGIGADPPPTGDHVGDGVTSETAAVITVDRVADAVRWPSALYIARQSVITSVGLSVGAMAVAAAGYLPPVAGALF
jgi:hypothetical protein